MLEQRGHFIQVYNYICIKAQISPNNAYIHVDFSTQSLRQRSKTRTNAADPGSASGATFQYMQFLPFLSIFSYLSYLGHTSLLGLQTKTRR